VVISKREVPVLDDTFEKERAEGCGSGSSIGLRVWLEVTLRSEGRRSCALRLRALQRSLSADAQGGRKEKHRAKAVQLFKRHLSTAAIS